MNDEKIEALLERITIAVEQIATAVVGGKLHQDKSTAEYLIVDNLSTEDDDAVVNKQEDCHRSLEAFLNSKGISIKVIPAEDAADQVIDNLSLFLGEHYRALSGILAKIKRAMQKGMTIEESLKGRAQVDVSTACQFCDRLHKEVAFLEQYKYFRSPTYLIKAKTTTMPRAQRFFGGQWLERFILQKVKSVHSQIITEAGCHQSFDFIVNPQITLSNGDEFELDILVEIGASIYWIEAKSGDYSQHVAKYSKFARTLGLDYEHSLMVLVDVPENRCNALSSLFTMTVCDLLSFEKKLLTVVRKDTTSIQRFVETSNFRGIEKNVSL